jgi:hypothetical protein
MAEPTSQPDWRKSSACGHTACVEIARIGDQVAIRNSRDPAAVLRFSQAEWMAFTERITAGDVPVG